MQVTRRRGGDGLSAETAHFCLNPTSIPLLLSPVRSSFPVPSARNNAGVPIEREKAANATGIPEELA